MRSQSGGLSGYPRAIFRYSGEDPRRLWNSIVLDYCLIDLAEDSSFTPWINRLQNLMREWVGCFLESTSDDIV
jgi:hypothetical protein